ncbi:MAG: lasso peptide biosynthesis B2 protein [Armatimonadota bacterium]|nr:lasso peptide biosynthesis B2 protein [Armatimonadota bacterium]
MVAERRTRLSLMARVGLVLRVWRWFAFVRLRVGTDPLPQLVMQLRQTAHPSPRRYPPGTLSRAVDRSLRFGNVRSSCLTKALVLFRLLREQGDPAELVIGLPEDGGAPGAHAWVELHGWDVGPPPGRGVHTALARFQ